MKSIISNSSIYELVIAAVFIVSFIIQLYYYFGVFFKLWLWCRRNKFEVKDFPPVSVVVCAKNEEENLRVFLPKILQQKYPNFEVVVVNDCSSDESEMLLCQMMQQYSNLKVTAINEDVKFVHSKKLALTVGIKSAQHDLLLLTDADCFPESDLWLASMVSCFTSKTEMVIGYGGYVEGKGLLNKIIRFDTLFNAMAYFGFAIKHKPYMAVGRNLAYRKSLFFKNRGFASHSHIMSGDDDLFVRDAATSSNANVCLYRNSFTRSIPQEDYSSWITQKCRHVSTSKYYKFGAKLRICFEPFSRLLFWATTIALFIENYFTLIVAGVVVFRLIVQLIITKASMNCLNEKKILLISPLWDFYSLYLYGKIHIMNAFTTKKRQWR